MGDLFTRLRRRVAVNSQRAVNAYTRELPDFRLAAADPRTRAGMVDVAVYLRERGIALVTDDEPLADEDLETMVAIGRQRGAAGISRGSHRQALLLHTSLILREVHEVAGPQDLHTLMHALRWLPTQGLAAQAAYTRGFLEGQQAHLPVGERVRQLVNLVLTGDTMAAGLAAGLDMIVPSRCVVLVVRIPQASPRQADAPRAEILADLLTRHWVPLSWATPREFVALVGADGAVSAEDRALTVTQDFGQLVRMPCAAGAAVGVVGELEGTLAQARQVCEVAPLRTIPSTVHYRTDLFAELAVAPVPPIDAWLHDVTSRLAVGPDLVTTLDAFYRNDMRRTSTAATLGVHPRTLDYRMQRVRELTGLDPVSVRAVRILSTAVTRVLAAPHD